MRNDSGGAGTTHRRGVAVHLAAHRPTGRNIALGDDGEFVPAHVEFETRTAIDDIVCTRVAERACSSRPSAKINEQLGTHALRAKRRAMLAGLACRLSSDPTATSRQRRLAQSGGHLAGRDRS